MILEEGLFEEVNAFYIDIFKRDPQIQLNDAAREATCLEFYYK